MHGEEAVELHPPSLYPVYVTTSIPRPTHFNSDDRGSMLLRNITIYLQGYIVSQLRKARS
jgi:hypothetical protein